MGVEKVIIGPCTLYRGDCESILPTLANGSVDAVITSPPYNLGGSPWPHLGNWKPGDSAGGKSKWRNGSDACNGVQYGTHRDSMDWDDYVAWQQSVIGCLWDLLPGDGAIFYNHKPRVIGGKLWLPLELVPPAVILRQIVIWARPGGMNFNPTAFVPTHEWIMVLARDLWRLKSRAVSGLGDVWRMNTDDNPHPAPFPLELPMRILEAIRAKVILDPFGGSGTTMVACVKSGRQGVAIENDPQWFDLMCRNVERAYLDKKSELPFTPAARVVQGEMFPGVSDRDQQPGSP